MEHEQKQIENVEKGIIPLEIVDQMREGHYWGVPLVVMADKSGFKPEVGKAIKMTVLPKKSFPIPEEGAIDYVVNTDLENKNKKTFASRDGEIGNIVEFEEIETKNILIPSTEYNGERDGVDAIPLEKKSLPHKGVWNRIKERENALVVVSDDFKKVNYPSGSFLMDLDEHYDFLEQFKNKFFGIIEIASQNAGAAAFGQKEMAAMFDEIIFTPFVNEEDINGLWNVDYLVAPENKKERNWSVIVTGEKGNKPMFSLKMKCTLMSNDALQRYLRKKENISSKKTVQEVFLEKQKEIGNGWTYEELMRQTIGKTGGIVNINDFNEKQKKVEMQPLETMPTKEEMKKGLEELIELGVARKLNDADPEQGIYFDIVEINCQGKDEFRDNNFIRGLAILREKIFRKTGEGTGKPSDWDSIDENVRQTITWDPKENSIVSASRMAVPRETLDKPTFFKNLYKTDEEFEKNILEKSVELGRTFLNEEYLQYLRNNKQIKKMRPAANSLFTGVLKQFETLIEEGHKLKYMHGAVSIDGRYSEQSLRRYAALYTHFFSAETMFNPLLVKGKGDIISVNVSIDEFEDESWVDLENFLNSEKQLRKLLGAEAIRKKAKHPTLLGVYPTFVGNEKGACAYFNPVRNKERGGCLEIGLLLDMSKVSYKVEQKYSLNRKSLCEEASIAKRVSKF